jgi:hypothetical protein
MKTFKQHIKETRRSQTYAQSYAGDAAGVGTQVQNSVEDSALGAHNIHDPEVLKRVNAFVGSIADGEFLKPQHAVDTLREKLSRIGLAISPVVMTGEKGTITAEVKQFGGRFGKDH